MKAPESFPCPAHEILGPIRGYTSLIQDDNPPGSNTRWWADKIMRDVEALEKHLALMDTLRTDAACAERTSWRDVIALALGWVYHFGAGARIEIRPYAMRAKARPRPPRELSAIQGLRCRDRRGDRRAFLYRSS